MAIVELFDKTDIKGYDSEGNATVGANGVPDQLDDLRNPSDKKKLLINEANLVFHIDNTSMGENILPKRIYLYDLTNATPVVDYLYDGTSSTNAKNGLLIYSGLLNTPESGDNNYKIRIFYFFGIFKIFSENVFPFFPNFLGLLLIILFLKVENYE